MRFIKFLIAVLIGSVATLLITILSIGYYLSPQDDLRQADAIIAISGGDTESRTLEAVRLYKEHYAPRLVFSGAALDPSGPSNAEAMRAIALKEDVPMQDILIEEGSKNTAENARSVVTLLIDYEVQKVILVTSPYHQRRADINFKRAFDGQVEIFNHSAPDQTWRRSYWWATPFSFQLTMSELQKIIYLLTTKPQ